MVQRYENCVAVRANCMRDDRIPRCPALSSSWTLWVNSLKTSSCTTVPVSPCGLHCSGLTECHAVGGAFSILHITLTYCHVIFTSVDCYRKPSDLCQMVTCRRLWYSGLCSSTRKYLQEEYSTWHICGTLIWMLLVTVPDSCHTFTRERP